MKFVFGFVLVLYSSLSSLVAGSIRWVPVQCDLAPQEFLRMTRLSCVEGTQKFLDMIVHMPEKETVLRLNKALAEHAHWFEAQKTNLAHRKRHVTRVLMSAGSLYSGVFIELYDERQWLWRSLYDAASPEIPEGPGKERAFKELLLKILLIYTSKSRSVLNRPNLTWLLSDFRSACSSRSPGSLRGIHSQICYDFRLDKLLEYLTVHELDYLLYRPGNVEAFFTEARASAGLLAQAAQVPFEMQPFLKHVCLAMKYKGPCETLVESWRVISSNFPHFPKLLKELRERYLHPSFKYVNGSSKYVPVWLIAESGSPFGDEDAAKASVDVWQGFSRVDQWPLLLRGMLYPESLVREFDFAVRHGDSVEEKTSDQLTALGYDFDLPESEKRRIMLAYAAVPPGELNKVYLGTKAVNVFVKEVLEHFSIEEFIRMRRRARALARAQCPVCQNAYDGKRRVPIRICSGSGCEQHFSCEECTREYMQKQVNIRRQAGQEQIVDCPICSKHVFQMGRHPEAQLDDHDDHFLELVPRIKEIVERVAPKYANSMNLLRREEVRTSREISYVKSDIQKLLVEKEGLEEAKAQVEKAIKEVTGRYAIVDDKKKGLEAKRDQVAANLAFMGQHASTMERAKAIVKFLSEGDTESSPDLGGDDIANVHAVLEEIDKRIAQVPEN